MVQAARETRVHISCIKGTSPADLGGFGSLTLTKTIKNNNLTPPQPISQTTPSVIFQPLVVACRQTEVAPPVALLGIRWSFCPYLHFLTHAELEVLRREHLH